MIITRHWEVDRLDKAGHARDVAMRLILKRDVPKHCGMKPLWKDSVDPVLKEGTWHGSCSVTLGVELV